MIRHENTWYSCRSATSRHGISHCLKTSVATAEVTDWSHRPINRRVKIHTASSKKQHSLELAMCVEIPPTEAELSACSLFSAESAVKKLITVNRNGS